jgi:2-hydroxycyclohexanecarboxyl-CoA dehydrogenase
MNERPLQDQSALVTGAASGIGRATAMALSRAGATIAIADRNEAGGRDACKSIVEAGGAAEFVALDLTDLESVRACADEALGRIGAPHVLVNAAGWDRLEPFLEQEPAFMEELVRLNLIGPVQLTRLLVPAMIDAGRGKVVNVASDAGRVGSSGETVYASAKGGIIAFTKSLAREMAKHAIPVNCVCPGPTDTPLFRGLPDKMQQALTRAIPFRRLATPEEIAASILFFSGPGSDYITGQVLSVSGGLTMAG